MRYEDFQIHPLADTFPLIEGDDFKQLVQSVREHGLIDPIVRQGEVLIDGRNRLRACIAAGHPPRFSEYDFPMPVEQFIWTKNMDRRHMDEDQRAAVVTRWEEFEANLANQRRLSGLNNQTVVPQDSAERDTRDALADRADVSRYKVEQALRLKKHDADHGTNLLKDVEAGRMRLREAEKEIEKASDAAVDKIVNRADAWNLQSEIDKVAAFIDGKVNRCPTNFRMSFRAAILRTVASLCE